MFIKFFLGILEDDKKILIILDEVGFGRPLRTYGYAKIGEPFIYKHGKMFPNITCTACISLNGIEGLRFFFKGGTTYEYYTYHFTKLVKKLKLKYP